MPGAFKDWNSKVILVEAEVTEGTDPTPTVALDAFRVLNYQPTFMDADQKVRALEKAFFGADPVAMAAFKRGATFDMEIHGGGLAAGTTVPPWMRMLRFCGFAAAVVGANAVTQAPTTSSITSATHYGWIDDLLLKTLGMRGSVGFTIEDDEYPRLSFNTLGRPPATLAEQSVPGNPTISGYIDPVLASTENTTFTYDGFAAPLRRFTMSDNATLEMRSLINPQDRVIYSGRAWRGEIVVEVGDLTAKNYFTGIREGTTKAAQVVHGVTPGNIVQVDTPRLQVTGNVALSQEQNRLMATFPVTALPNTGNDEILFTSK
jgi:hypothetical protein